MAGFRNIAVHDYFNVDLRYVWEIVSIDLPELKKCFEGLRAEMLDAS